MPGAGGKRLLAGTKERAVGVLGDTSGRTGNRKSKRFQKKKVMPPRSRRLREELLGSARKTGGGLLQLTSPQGGRYPPGFRSWEGAAQSDGHPKGLMNAATSGGSLRSRFMDETRK